MAKELIGEIDNEIIEYFFNVEQDYLIDLKEKKGYEALKETLRKFPINKLKDMINDKIEQIPNKIEQNKKGEISDEDVQRQQGEISVMCEAYAEEVIEQDLEKHDDLILAQRLIELEKDRKEKEKEHIMNKYDNDITKSSLFDRDRLDRIEKRDDYLNNRQKQLDNQIKSTAIIEPDERKDNNSEIPDIVL